MTQLFENRYNGLKNKFNSSEVPIRQQAFDFFKSQGLPTRKDENFKYTSLQFLTKSEFSSATNSVEKYLSKIKENLESHFYHLIFFNGVFQPQLSDQIPDLKIAPFALKADPFEDSLMALNWALSENPICLEVPDGKIVDKPVQILFYNASNAPTISFPHLQIIVGEKSRLTLIENYLGEGNSANNAFVKVTAKKSCHLTYVHCQEQDSQAYHLARTNFDIFQDAHVESLSFSTGALLARHSQKYSLKAPGAFVKSLGLYLVAGHQHSDHSGLIDHEVGHCTSYQTYKGLLKDESRAVFSGKVLIRKNSQKAFSEQSNKNLLLSNGAEVDSKPQLEIYADDVQARHGSTVGQLDPEQLFYLNSRGISSAKALPMLSYGFLSDVIYQIEDERVVKWLTPRLQKVLQDLHLENL